MKKEPIVFKIHQSKCEINKRRLVVQFAIKEHDWDKRKDLWYTYRLELDHWKEEGIKKLTRNGESILTTFDTNSENLVLGNFYKHNCQAIIYPNQSETPVIIDRRYRHNYSCDVYFDGQHYTAGKERI